ncbi:arylsulfatase [Marinobacterium nitratireducens]|nr:arylsulfatase [Marinobacterium nitratireducens]
MHNYKKMLFHALSAALLSVVGPAESLLASETRPNILLIVADDLGYSDIGAYGGEINTPNLDALAGSGLTMTNFHANPSCSPTRASLMSGTDSHLAGLGIMYEMRHGAASPEQLAADGYKGYLLPELEAFPTKLRQAGYHTYMVGKWHLANVQGGLAQTIPAARGFERSFSLVQGGASHYGDSLAALPSPFPVGAPRHNQHALYTEDWNIGTELPADFYSTTFYTDKLIEYIESDSADGQPFFAYAAYTAPHWPLQLPLEAKEEGSEWQRKFQSYQAQYEAGYDALIHRRLAKMKRLGIIARDAEYDDWAEYGRGNGIPAWNSLSSEERKRKAREMAVYAVMVEYMDYQIGRLLARVDQENTVVVFMSDNGAEATSPRALWNSIGVPADSGNEYENLLRDSAGTGDYNGYDNLGFPGSYFAYDPGWARVSGLPHRGYKSMTSEGGISVPMILSGPGVRSDGALSGAFGTVMDLAPTFLQLAQADSPVQELRGESMLPFLAGDRDAIHAAGYGVGWELLGGKAYIEDGYKLFALDPRHGGDGVSWSLYDLVNDRAEQHDLFWDPGYAERVEHLLQQYERYADDTGVVPYP